MIRRPYRERLRASWAVYRSLGIDPVRAIEYARVVSA